MSLIDDQGMIWDGHSAALRQGFDSPFSGGEFSSYAVRNLGFIALDIFGRTCQVRVSPRRVASKALVTLLEWLAKRRFERISAAWFEGDWRYEIFPSIRDGLDRITSLIEHARAPEPTDFIARPMSVTNARQARALTELRARWHDLCRPERYRELEGLVRRAVGNRYVFVQHCSDREKLVFREFGEGIFDHIKPWRIGAVGQPIADLPDRNYGRWVASSYEATLAAGHPTVDDVDVIVNWPHRGRSRLRYRRFIVPIAQDTDTPLLLGGSVFDETIDLRVAST